MYYQFKTFNPLPDWIEDLVLSPETTRPQNWINYFPSSYANRQITKKDGSTAITQTFKRYGLDKDVWDWVRANTYQNIVDCCACVTEFNNQDCAPHRDRNRRFTLLWVIETGGDRVETCFWKEDGSPLREDISSQHFQQPSDYRNLTKLDGVVIPPRQWVLLDAKVIHSVENIVGKRISFQVSLDSAD